ncbi:MAG TPA: tautomerase PptA [Saliniramus sp.]|nr:tautomerase PptA [Saliniramus sp.]
MPHVNIKHFPRDISEAQKAELVEAVSLALKSALGCSDDAISIALEPVAPEVWQEQVYGPEIEGRRELLVKTPNY